jgi:hypothetical protein
MSYRVVIESYDAEGTPGCYVGFVPSHDALGAAVAAAPGYGIHHYAGWYISILPSSNGSVDDSVFTGWRVLQPALTDGGEATEEEVTTNMCATTAVVPPVPAGSAIELAVDYLAGTCHVAFYTAAAVTGGFVEAPHAKMQLRFVATERQYNAVAPSPAAADSGVELHPAVSTHDGAGTIWRFA